MPRAELDDLLTRYRAVFARRYQESPRVLHWQLPGSVWAIDFAEPSEPGGRTLPPIDGADAYLLAVRDLASGQQLLWLPVEGPTAAEVTTALAGLFALYGPPLVLKSDNGPAFTAEPTQAFLATAGVLSLFSPPYWPAYNGAIEAGIGSLKTRTARHAARHGHPGLWTRDDLAAARLEANSALRPHGVTPTALWQSRRPLTAAERLNFQATVAHRRPEARLEQGVSPDAILEPTTQRAVDRRALERALVEHDYLLYTRRRIPLRIR